MSNRELESKLEAVRSRGDVKALGARVDADPSLREQVFELAARRGTELDREWNGKRLVRALLARQEDARERRNPVRRDTAFRCTHCGRAVDAGGARVRDHCPWCLRGLHVDRVPGDRASDCGGVLDPVAFELKGRAGVVITFRCRKCGYSWSGRAHPTDRVPPSLRPEDIEDPEVADEAVEGAAARLAERARTLPMRVLDAVRSGALWAPGDGVVLAVSGGVDSMVMLELLARTRGAHGGTLHVVSFDHGLRPEAVVEVAMVGRRARELGLPFRGPRLDLAPGANLQARARDARRATLLAVAAEVGASRVALAHHQDDQAETVLQHLLRGSGLGGLAGMQALDPPWCRPLLREPRAVIEAWARIEGVAWREDPSNPLSQRGRLRVLMPLLDEIHGGAAAALARTARLLAREDRLLEDLVDGAWDGVVRDGGLDVASLQAQHPALQLRLLRRLVGSLPHPLRADHLEGFLGWTAREGARLPLSGGWCLEVEGGVIRTFCWGEE